ncbi:MAG: DUF4062 domain-containing protein [Bacteroidales bacterium]|nr:DUF4062 domain-containing protein [Bacteroidales bacterium]
MAKIVFFISSTYIDLKQEREDIADFLKSLGHEAYLHERGDIAYGSKESLDRYIYESLDNIDILIGVIGKRLGSRSTKGGASVTQDEIRTAIEKGKKVFLFAHHDVLTEYNTYKNNKKSKRIKYITVDSVETFYFLDYLYSREINNFICGFNTVKDIKEQLLVQLSGLFKLYLNEANKRTTLYQGAKFTIFRKRELMMDYFNIIMDEAKSGDIIWAQGVGHTAYPKSFSNRFKMLLNNGVSIRIIANKHSPQFEDFVSILRNIPGVEWYASELNTIRVFGLSDKELIIALPTPELYEAILIKDKSFVKVWFNWFDNRFNELKHNC